MPGSAAWLESWLSSSVVVDSAQAPASAPASRVSVRNSSQSNRSIHLHFCSLPSFCLLASAHSFPPSACLVLLSRGPGITILLAVYFPIFNLPVYSFIPWWRSLGANKCCCPVVRCSTYLSIRWLSAACRVWSGLERLPKKIPGKAVDSSRPTPNKPKTQNPQTSNFKLQTSSSTTSLPPPPSASQQFLNLLVGLDLLFSLCLLALQS